MSARIFKGWGVILLLMFFIRESFTSSINAGTTLVTFKTILNTALAINKKNVQ